MDGVAKIIGAGARSLCLSLTAQVKTLLTIVGDDVTTNCTTDDPDDDVDKTFPCADWGTWVKIKVCAEDGDVWFIFVTAGMMTVGVAILGAIAIGFVDWVT